MPYIPQAMRRDADQALDSIYDGRTLSQGDLTYLIYKAMKRYVYCHPACRPDYVSLSNAIAAATDAAAEFRRMELDPYEDRKRELNGPIE
jgi:hypothetical protein